MPNLQRSNLIATKPTYLVRWTKTAWWPKRAWRYRFWENAEKGEAQAWKSFQTSEEAIS
jgi:hypothetical protein